MKALLLLSALLLVSPAPRAEELPLVVNGQVKDAVEAYKIGNAYFLAAKDAGLIYGGQVYWYPVSGRVQFSLRGRALQFQVDSDKVQVGQSMVKLDSPVMLRTSQAYLPLSFFESEEWADWAGFDTTFNPRTKLVTVDRRATVGPVRWFSYKDYTRVSVDLTPRVAFKATARGVGGVEVAFPLGTIDAPEEASIGDGVVELYSVAQNAQQAKLTVKFAKPSLVWKAKELKNPRRLVVDVFKAGVVETPDEAVAPAEVVEAKPKAPVAEEPPARSVRRKIVVDAGHGGKDPGATGNRGTQEKDINLKAALELAKLLKEEGTFEVVLTRDNDTFVPLSDRSRMANELGADLFVSLHCNASRHTKDHGFEVYFLSEKASDPESQRLADFENSSLELEGKSTQDAQAELLLLELGKTENINQGAELAVLTARALEKRVDLSNNGVKQAGFYVLRGTHAPAILFEMAYISNKKDEAKLESKKFRRKLVDGVYAGIIDYAKRQGWMNGGSGK